nr:hypothetical protein CFP56_28832 [Quercus suber]
MAFHVARIPGNVEVCTAGELVDGSRRYSSRDCWTAASRTHFASRMRISVTSARRTITNKQEAEDTAGDQKRRAAGLPMVDMCGECLRRRDGAISEAHVCRRGWTESRRGRRSRSREAKATAVYWRCGYAHDPVAQVGETRGWICAMAELVRERTLRHLSSSMDHIFSCYIRRLSTRAALLLLLRYNIARPSAPFDNSRATAANGDDHLHTLSASTHASHYEFAFSGVSRLGFQAQSQ